MSASSGVAPFASNNSVNSPQVPVATQLAQIFSTGISPYVDSQAVQNGLIIQNPQIFQGGYPAGSGAQYTPTQAGQSVAVAQPGNQLLASGKTAFVVIAVALLVLVIVAKA